MNLLAPLASSILPWIVPGYPGISLFKSREKARRLTCTEMDTDAAAREYPGQIEPERPRGDYVARRTIVCREQLLPSGTRAERQSAVLMRLEDTAVEVARHVSAIDKAAEARVWLVETYDADPRLAHKLRFAVQNALHTSGARVADRTPHLQPADIDVISRLPINTAYAAACQRYAQNGSLGEQEGLVAIVQRDPRETETHAAVCIDGVWSWLR